MRRPPLSTQGDGRRRSGGEQLRHGAAAAAAASASAAPCSTATIAAWTRSCLVSTTAHLLTAQPADPLRALGLRFTTAAVLLATYPETPATCAEDELAEEKAWEVGRGISSAVPVPLASSKPPIAGGGGSTYRASHAASSAGPAADHLIAQAWVRRRLQPYGLHAVARCVCPCPALRCDAAPPPPPPPPLPLTLQAQWLDIFALLHRQSRMTVKELAAASTAAAAPQAGLMAITPPLDFRVSYEVPAALVVLYAMALVEEHLRRADLGGGGRGRGPRDAAQRQGPSLCRRQQLAVKLLALRLLAVCVEAQDRASDAASSCSSGSGEGRCDAADASCPVPSGVDKLFVADTLQRLSVQELEVLHQWLHGQLREEVILAPSPLTARVTAASRPPLRGDECGRGPGDGSRDTEEAGAEAPLAALQAHARTCLARVLRGGAGGEAADALVMVSQDTFVRYMECLAAVMVAHQHTVVSMSLVLAARLPRGTSRTCADGDERGGGSLVWVAERVRACAAALVAHMADKPRPAPLPPACGAYVRQLADVLAPLCHDVAVGNEETRDGAWRAAIEERLTAWEPPELLCSGAAGAAPRVAVVAMVGHWVSHSVEVLISGLYSL